MHQTFSRLSKDLSGLFTVSIFDIDIFAASIFTVDNLQQAVGNFAIKDKTTKRGTLKGYNDLFTKQTQTHRLKERMVTG